jgi:peptidoglycan/LPS O-acetylase OafA/YrhL
VGTAAIPVFFEVTCYYHAVLVALVLLWPRWKLAGLAMIGLACVSLALGRVPMGRDQYFFWMNLATLVVVVLVMGGLVLARPRAEEPAPS